MWREFLRFLLCLNFFSVVLCQNNAASEVVTYNASCTNSTTENDQQTRWVLSSPLKSDAPECSWIFNTRARFILEVTVNISMSDEGRYDQPCLMLKGEDDKFDLNLGHGLQKASYSWCFKKEMRINYHNGEGCPRLGREPGIKMIIQRRLLGQRYCSGHVAWQFTCNNHVMKKQVINSDKCRAAETSDPDDDDDHNDDDDWSKGELMLLLVLVGVLGVLGVVVASKCTKKGEKEVKNTLRPRSAPLSLLDGMVTTSTSVSSLRPQQSCSNRIQHQVPDSLWKGSVVGIYSWEQLPVGRKSQSPVPKGSISMKSQSGGKSNCSSESNPYEPINTGGSSKQETTRKNKGCTI